MEFFHNSIIARFLIENVSLPTLLKLTRFFFTSTRPFYLRPGFYNESLDIFICDTTFLTVTSIFFIEIRPLYFCLKNDFPVTFLPDPVFILSDLTFLIFQSDPLFLKVTRLPDFLVVTLLIFNYFPDFLFVTEIYGYSEKML